MTLDPVVGLASDDDTQDDEEGFDTTVLEAGFVDADTSLDVDDDDDVDEADDDIQDDDDDDVVDVEPDGFFG